MVMACGLLNIHVVNIGDQHYWTIATILAIYDTFTVVAASQAGIPNPCAHACQRNLVTFAKAHPHR